MEYTLDRILDVQLVQVLQDKLNELNPFPSALIANDGKILTATAWQDICTKFHRMHPESELECIRSDSYIKDHLPEANPAVSYRCPHGMVDNAIPILVEGQHVGTFFTGQFFLEAPDLDFFRAQAKRFGFDEDAYLRAVEQVPVWAPEQVPPYLDFMKTFIESQAGVGLSRLRESEARQMAVELENKYQTLVDQASDGIFLSDDNGDYTDVNSRGCQMIGYSREEILKLNIRDLLMPEDLAKTPPRLDELRKGDFLISERVMRRKDGSGLEVEISAKMLKNGLFQGIVRDITERRESGKRLLESELRFRTIVETTEAGYFFIDKDGIIREVNDSWVRLYKYASRDEIIGHHFAGIQRIDDVAQATDVVRHILNGDPSYMNGEFSRRCKDDSIGYHTFSARPVVSNGETIGLEGFILDITDRKLAEMERDQSRLRLRSVFEKMVEGFALHEMVFDEQGNPVDYRFLDVNPAFEKLTGLVAADIIGKTALEVIPGLEPFWIETYGRVAQTGIPVTFENRVGSMGSTYRVIAFSNEKGQFATLFDDITVRKHAEEKLRTLAHAIDNIRECVSMTDTENNLIFVNKAFCNTYGYSPDELIGRNITMVRPASDEGDGEVAKILSETLGGGWSGEAINRKKDGTLFPVFISTAIVRDEEDKVVALIGIATDITERKKAEAELVAAKERAEESDKLKSAFLANISHEIRTPMNSILGFTELLVEMSDDPIQQSYLKIISSGGERLLKIINSVIDLAKIEAGQTSVFYSHFDLNSLLRELYELNKRNNPGVKFLLELAGKTSIPLFTDKTKLFQILNNLITNALKYTKKGSVKFGYNLQPGAVTFYVRDTGIGIPESFHSQLFQRFRKVDLNDRSDFEGTGLGLAISKELVKLLGGEIWFESAAGKGTVFYVRLKII